MKAKILELASIFYLLIFLLYMNYISIGKQNKGIYFNICFAVLYEMVAEVVYIILKRRLKYEEYKIGLMGIFFLLAGIIFIIFKFLDKVFIMTLFFLAVFSQFSKLCLTILQEKKLE